MRHHLLLIAVLLVPQTAAARDLFVDNVRGSDTNDALTTEYLGLGRGPCRTIAKALRLAMTADRIVVANTGVPYKESITLQGGDHSGTAISPFVLEGNGAVLDGSLPVPAGAWEHVQGDVFRFRPARLHHQQLFLGDQPAARVRADRLGPVPPDLQPLEWSIYRQAIHFRAEEGRLPRSYPLRYAALPVGITLYEVRHVVIHNLIVQGFQLDGINAHDGVERAVLSGLTSRGNGRSGISIGGASRVLVEACLVGNNGEAQIRTEGHCIVHVANSDLVDEPGAPAHRIDGGRFLLDGRQLAPAE